MLANIDDFGLDRKAIHYKEAVVQVTAALLIGNASWQRG